MLLDHEGVRGGFVVRVLDSINIMLMELECYIS